ncbi:MAG: 2Fe-2S iron-sulfur cluster-binding protein, partial [Anaerolineales bacterium]
MENKISLTVNGQQHSLTVNPTETLADALRKRLKLTGTKIGCEEAECGTCTVLVNGEPTLSCVYPAARADGKEILTIEGLANTDDGKLVLHPLQEAFVQHGAVQCGFCIPGQILTSYALLKRNPNPTSEELRHALKDTLCRCAGYPTIENAIMDAAKALRTGEPILPPHIPDSINAKNIIGHSQIRPDAIEKVTGDAIYTDDLEFDNMLFAHARRAGVPHAILKSLDISKAKELPGVVAVLTADDIPAEHNHGLVVFDWPVMVGVGERVRYVGDTLAIVAAETQEIAEQAVALIEAEFEPQTIVKDAVQAYQPDAPRLHESGNLLKHIKVRKGNMEEGFAKADVVLEHTFHTAITDHAFLEPECSIAVPLEDGRMEIYVGSQIPYQDRTQVSRVLGWPEERVRIVGQLMGG